MNPLARIIAKFYEAIYREGREERREGIHVTSLAYPCLRKAYYDLKLEHENISLDSAFRMYVGKKVHETPLLSENEIELSYNGVKGRVDEYDGKTKFLLEKKTTRKIPSQPYPHHINQLEMYKVLLEKNGKPVEQAAIMYIQLRPFDVRVQPVELRPTEEVLKEMMDKKAKLEQALKHGFIPEREGIESDWACAYCPYPAQCFGE